MFLKRREEINQLFRHKCIITHGVVGTSSYLSKIHKSWNNIMLQSRKHVLRQCHILYFKQNMFVVKESKCKWPVFNPCCVWPSSYWAVQASVQIRIFLFLFLFLHTDVCPCPEIPLVNLTKTPPTHCFQIDEKFRYECKAGYVRQAGTSNLIRCIQSSNGTEWTQNQLKCKRNVYSFFYYLVV